MANINRPPAGLTYAPPLSEPTDIAEPATGTFDLKELAFYKDQERKSNLRARLLLFSAVFVMLIANLWLTNRNNQAVLEQAGTLIENIDQARADQTQLAEYLEQQMETMMETVAGMQSAQAPVEEDVAVEEEGDLTPVAELP